MKVAKFTIWDGSQFYTNQIEKDHFVSFFNNARKEFESGKRVDEGIIGQIDILEMTPEEYNAIPVTEASAKLFGG